MRASKIIIPIALAISLVFAGFSVYAKEAEYFVLRVNNPEGINLALTMNRDLSGQTRNLRVPVNGGYNNTTWYPDTYLQYDEKKYGSNLPDDIAQHDGEHSVWETSDRMAYFSFSFWIVNNSDRAVDVDWQMYIDGMTVINTEQYSHMDDAVRIMVIEGEPLLSENTYRIYKKAEKTQEDEDHLNSHIAYGTHNTYTFENDVCIFDRSDDLGILNFEAGGTRRFTIVIWLEGWDVDCVDMIRSETMKMSINFTAK